MKTATLYRGQSTNQGTFGRFVSSDYICLTVELPWRNNAPQLSCIPEGKYLCLFKLSPKFGWVYHVTGVPGRGDILIHPGNYAGDVTRGFRSHSHGCILLATRIGNMDGQTAGLISATAVRRLEDALNKEPFLLEIKNA